MLMETSKIEQLCEHGQDQLSRMEYLEAERTLAAAEEIAWWARDWDTLARLYMPLQEARRQRRQRCGEGIIRTEPSRHRIGRSARWATIGSEYEPRPDSDRRLGFDSAGHRRQAGASWNWDCMWMCSSAAVYPIESGRIVAIVPGDDVMLPPVDPMPVDATHPAIARPQHRINRRRTSAAKTYAATDGDMGTIARAVSGGR